MRYLQTYKLFESSSEDIKQVIKDILLPISDMDYEISVTEDNSHLIIRVVLWTDDPLLITDEVKEEFMRMKDYLESEGYNSILVRYWSPNSVFTAGGQGAPSSERFDYFINNVEGLISNLLFVAKKL